MLSVVTLGSTPLASTAEIVRRRSLNVSVSPEAHSIITARCPRLGEFSTPPAPPNCGEATAQAAGLCANCPDAPPLPALSYSKHADHSVAKPLAPVNSHIAKNLHAQVANFGACLEGCDAKPSKMSASSCTSLSSCPPYRAPSEDATVSM